MKVIIEKDKILNNFIVFEYINKTTFNMIKSFKTKKEALNFCKKLKYDIITLERTV